MLRGLLTILCAVCLSCQGQMLRGMWAAMPDSLMPTIEKSQRMVLIDLYDIRMKAVGDTTLKAVVPNLLHGESRLDTLTNDFLRLVLNDCSVWEMKLLPGKDNATDSLLCVSHTLFGELPESKVSFFSSDWELLSDTIYTSSQLILKPDTMSVSAFSEALEQVSVVLWEARLSADTDELMLSPSFPFTTREMREQLQPLFLQRKLKWNGQTFN